MHGYPDNSDVWRGVVERLADRFHVVAYDVRGAGKSDDGDDFGGYGIELLIEDLAAVIDAVSFDDEKVHLVAHDWGAIQCGSAVADPAIASYTYFWAPSLDHAAHWIRGLLRPDPRKLGTLGGQLARSWYIAAFHLPVGPKTAWRYGLDRLFPLVIGALEPIAASDLPTSAELRKDGANGVELYRANVIPKLLSPGPGYIDLPVQVIALARDPFAHPGLFDEAQRRIPDLTVRTLAAGHWAQRSNPDEVARLVTEFVTRCSAQTDAGTERKTVTS